MTQYPSLTGKQVLAALGDNAVVKQILNFGVKNYIVKPINKNTFVTKVSEILEQTVKSN